MIPGAGRSMGSSRTAADRRSAVDGAAQGIDDPAEERLSNRDADNRRPSPRPPSLRRSGRRDREARRRSGRDRAPRPCPARRPRREALHRGASTVDPTATRSRLPRRGRSPVSRSAGAGANPTSRTCASRMLRSASSARVVTCSRSPRGRRAPARSCSHVLRALALCRTRARRAPFAPRPGSVGSCSQGGSGGSEARLPR